MDRGPHRAVAGDGPDSRRGSWSGPASSAARSSTASRTSGCTRCSTSPHTSACGAPSCAGLCWADVDLATRRIHVRQAQVDDELDSTKSEDSERIVIIDQGTADVLRAWRKAQLAERMAWAGVWTDSGRVWTREDGTALRPGGISQRFDTLVSRLGLPPVTLHGLRHGSATMARVRSCIRCNIPGPM